MSNDGFSGPTPYEICQRYAAGVIDRVQLVDELIRFPYVKAGETDGYDSLIVDEPGAWSEVGDAVRRGLIEEDIYEEVFNRRHGNEPGGGDHGNSWSATMRAEFEKAREVVTHHRDAPPSSDSFAQP